MAGLQTWSQPSNLLRSQRLALLDQLRTATRGESKEGSQTNPRLIGSAMWSLNDQCYSSAWPDDRETYSLAVESCLVGKVDFTSKSSSGWEKKSSYNRGKQRGLRKQGAGPTAQRKVPTQRKGTRGKQAMSKSLPLSLPNAAFVVDAKRRL